MCPCSLCCPSCMCLLCTLAVMVILTAFYLFKVLWPWFICLYTNLLFIVFAFSFFLFVCFCFFVLLTKLSWPKLTCKVEKVLLPITVLDWKMPLCNIWCLFAGCSHTSGIEEKDKTQSFWRESLGWGRTWRTMKVFLLTREVWLYQSVDICKSTGWFPEMVNDLSSK